MEDIWYKCSSSFNAKPAIKPLRYLALLAVNPSTLVGPVMIIRTLKNRKQETIDQKQKSPRFGGGFFYVFINNPFPFRHLAYQELQEQI
jgi:hypothetical protein